MDRKRKVYAPFSQTSEAGVTQTPVEGYIDVSQMIYPTVSTGVVNEKGQWAGVKSSDTEFSLFTKHVEVPNGGNTLNPDTGDTNFIDMVGFDTLLVAIKPTNAGNVLMQAVMGPDTNRYANLEPVNAAALTKIINQTDSSSSAGGFFNALDDSAENLTANVWNIFTIYTRLKDQRNLQIKIINNSGDVSTMEVAFMRLVE